MARVRITVDIEEPYKRAFSAWASIEGESPQELLERLIEEHCPAEILDRAKKSAAEDDDRQGGAKGRKGK